MISNWMADIMALGGFLPRAARMANHDSAHSPHTKKRHKRVPNRERNRRAAQSRSMKKRGGKR